MGIHLYGAGAEIRDAGDALAFLHVNIEILVTILTVTMSVTLLGIQFRAQSYTMHALIKYIKDPVIYGFIGTFVALIIFSMLATTTSLLPDPQSVAQYASAGTAFSLAYLAGYIYYMIYRIQPPQVLRQTYLDMKKQLGAYMDSGEELDSGKLEGFDIWEQIMLKSIETDNISIFRQGIDMMFTLWRGNIITRTGKNDEGIIFFSTLIMTVAQSCIKEGRTRFVEVFMENFMSALMQMLDKQTGEPTDTMFDTWAKIVTSAIDGNNATIFQKGMEPVTHIMEDITGKYKNRDKLAGYFHARVGAIMLHCMARNREQLIEMFMGWCKSVPGPRPDNNVDKAYRKAMFDAWASIMLKAAETGNKHVFEFGIAAVFVKWRAEVESGSEDYADAKFLTDLINDAMSHVVEHGREDLAVVFLDAVKDEILYVWESGHQGHDRLMFETWEGMMIRAVEFGNIHIFSKGIKVAGDLQNKHLNAAHDGPGDMNHVVYAVHPVLEACLEHNRGNFVASFVHSMGDAMMRQDSAGGSYQIALSSIWYYIMKWSMRVGDGEVFDVIMHKINPLRLKYYAISEKEPDMDTRMFIHLILLVVDASVKHGRPDFMAAYMPDIRMTWLHHIRYDKHVFTIDAVSEGWEQMMTWAVRNNKYEVFRGGISMMLEAYVAARSSKTNDAITSSLVFRYNAVVSEAASSNSGNFVKMVVNCLRDSLIQKRGDGWERVLDLWDFVAEKSVQAGNTKVLDDIVSVAGDLEGEKSYEILLPLFHSAITGTARMILLSGRDAGFEAYFGFMARRGPGSDDTRLRDMTYVWEDVMHRAVHDGRMLVFRSGMESIFEVMRGLPELDERGALAGMCHSAITRVLEGAAGGRHVEEFLARFRDAFSEMGADARLPLDVWRSITIRAAHSQNASVFDAAIGMSDGVFGEDDAEFFKRFSQSLSESSDLGTRLEVTELVSRLDGILGRK